eukprot:jgi/Tetstr1/465587/TSEL_010234.t1
MRGDPPPTLPLLTAAPILPLPTSLVIDHLFSPRHGPLASEVEAVIEYGFTIHKITGADPSPEARTMWTHSLHVISDKYPDKCLPPSAFHDCHAKTPMDVNDTTIAALETLRPVTLIVSGPPCQPLPRAGLRLGWQDHGSRAFASVISFIRFYLTTQPTPVRYIGENVPGALDFPEILSSLGTGNIMRATACGSAAHRDALLWTNIALQTDVQNYIYNINAIELTDPGPCTKDEAPNAARMHGTFVKTARGARRSAARPHAGRDGAVVASLESQVAAAQSTAQKQQLARRSVEEQLVGMQAEVKQLRKGEAVQSAEQIARAVHDKDKQLAAGMRVQLERARKEATLENTRRHLPLVKRKHEEVSEALEIAAKRAGGIIKHITNAVKNLAATQAVPGDSVDEGSSPEPPAKKTKQPAKPEAGGLARGRGGAGARAGGGALGSWAGRRAAVAAAASHEQQAGRRGRSVSRLSGFKGQRWIQRCEDGIVDSAGAYMGVKQTTGVTKVVRHDGLQNNSLVGNSHVLMYEGDYAYEVLAEKGKRFFGELNDIAIKGVTLPDSTKRKVPDLLHMNLRITAGLSYYTVQRHCATAEDMHALPQWMFDELGITVNSKKRHNKKQYAASIGQKKESFIGAECVKLIAQYDKALEHVRETYPTVSASDDVKAQTAWEIWKQLWELLLEPVDPARAPGTAQLPPLHLREARAQHVKQVAEKFVQAFVNAAGENDAATMYCHILQCHIHDYIRWYGDLMNYGCHGSEHAHSVTKTAYRRGTAGHPEFRVVEVFGYMKIHEHELPTP